MMNGDSYRPHFGGGYPPPPLPNGMFSLEGARRNDNNYGSRNRDYRDNRPRNRRDNARPHYQRPLRTPATRPLLRQSLNDEGQILRDTSAADKYRNLEDLTDSEEDEMSESDGDNEEDDRPSKKAKRDNATSQTAAVVSKWSNPDPYTALPPPSDSTGKRTDVLKLIRKAKVQSTKSDEKPDDGEDFISFNFDEDEDDYDEEDEVLLAAPNGPRSNGFRDSRMQIDGSALDNTGKRKRGNQTAIPKPPGGYLPSNQLVLKQWRALSSSTATPWLQPVSGYDNSGTALHKEVIDFFEWVKPQEYEREVRADIVNRLQLAFNRIERGELKAFGSYAAGLYLPIGDMDLVYFTSKYNPRYVGRLPPRPARKLLERFATFLKTSGIAKLTTVILIPNAKVPIIKFVEARSGLHVDLSFDNDSGTKAVDTFLAWKALHPVMPIIVSVVKQFLMIRGLNDVSLGGLGGFSIICLVTSLLQHMPGTGAITNVGQLLVEFFNLYGYILDRDTVALRLDPPAYVDKNSIEHRLDIPPEKGKSRLTIIDPNRPTNNISGGTRLIDEIFGAFRVAHDLLIERLTAHEDGDVEGSFLHDLVGGNFQSYEQQRNQLAILYTQLTGHAPDDVRSGRITRVMTDSTNGIEPSIAGSDKHSKNETPAKRRALRMRNARPELAKRIPASITVAEACKIGGYENGEDFAKDMQDREQAALEEEKKTRLEKRRKQARRERSPEL